MSSSANTPRKRVIMPQPIGQLGRDLPDEEAALLAQLGGDTVFMMGDNPALPALPDKPQLLDFYRLRFGAMARSHLLQSAKLALDAGLDEKVVLACLLHDIAMGALIRVDHGFWGAQLIAPYVDEEIVWAVRNHQVLRFFPDASVGYAYPDSYVRFFGPDYTPPPYICDAYKEARRHRWYMTSRLITLNDLYAFEEGVVVDPDLFTDIIGRHFSPRKDWVSTIRRWRICGAR